VDKVADWKKTWVCAAVVVVCVLFAAEITARALGDLPGVEDDAALWAHWREQAEGAGPETVVIIGTSRLRTDIDLEAWREEFPGRRVIMLAIDGSYFFPVLEDLAADENFRGVVLCDLKFPTVNDAVTLRYLDHYHHQWNAFEKFKRNAGTWLQMRLVLVNSSSLPRRFLDSLRKRRPLSSLHLQVLPDRQLKADYRKDHHQPLWKKNPLRLGYKEEDFLPFLASLKKTGNLIRARGGSVLFAELPTTGVLKEGLDENFKELDYFRTFEKETGFEVLSLEKIPGAADLECPDSSHLDYRDAPRFTRLLASVLKERGLL